MIAAVIGAFDFVTVVELRDDMHDMRRVLDLLGPRWGIVFSDYLRDAGGNRERVGFVFDRERVRFTGLASTAEGPRRRVGDHYVRALPCWRPPFLASFQCGHFDFILVAAHIRWGRARSARRQELEALVDWLGDRADETYFGDRDVIAVGDFNVAASDQAADILGVSGFVVPPALREGTVTDLARRKRYDQILYRPRYTKNFTGRAGSLDFYGGDHHDLFPRRRLTKQAFTFQLSDHLPLWAELEVGASLP